MEVFRGERARVISREVGFLVLVGVNRVRVRLRGLVNEVFGKYFAF